MADDQETSNTDNIIGIGDARKLPIKRSLQPEEEVTGGEEGEHRLIDNTFSGPGPTSDEVLDASIIEPTTTSEPATARDAQRKKAVKKKVSRPLSFSCNRCPKKYPDSRSAKFCCSKENETNQALSVSGGKITKGGKNKKKRVPCAVMNWVSPVTAEAASSESESYTKVVIEGIKIRRKIPLMSTSSYQEFFRMMSGLDASYRVGNYSFSYLDAVNGELQAIGDEDYFSFKRNCSEIVLTKL